MPHESAPSTVQRRSPFAAFLVLVLVASILPGAALAADPVPLGQPGAHYEEARAHADDEISFAPGGRVTVGYTATAKTKGGTRVLTRLPAGLLSGREMAAGKVSAEAADTSDGAIVKVLAEESPAASASIGPERVAIRSTRMRRRHRYRARRPLRPPAPTPRPPRAASASRSSASCPTGSSTPRR